MPPLPNRQVHLDFHTGPSIPDVGSSFDAEAFASTLADARVNSITLFAKCHHGHLYYDTHRPERHPGLARSRHLLEEQTEACRRRGIRTPIYLSVMCDEFAANLHPDWLCRNPDGTTVGRTPVANTAMAWQILDMSSPYASFLEEQIAEVVGKFKPVDGIFFDMCWDQPSVSKWAIDGMRKASLNPKIEADRNTYARQVSHQYMQRYNSLLTRINGSLPRVWYNSRPKTGLAEEAKYLQHIEIEALPTGGWGYTYFPLNVRWARNFDLPFVGMTARFHKSWSDFGGYKPDAALKYEVCQMLAHGGGCSIGDQLHPRGVLDVEAYRLIGTVYRHVEAVEAFCDGATAVTEVAVLRDPIAGYHIAPGGTFEGAVRMLQQLLVQFDFLSPTSDLSRYMLTIVPEGIDLSGAAGRHLQSYLVAGGKVIIAGVKPLRTASSDLLAAAGVAAITDAGATTPFFRYASELVQGVETTDFVCYDGTLRLSPAAGARVPARIVEPYFQRAWDQFSGHNQTPPATVTEFAPVTLGSTAAAFGFDVFAAYGTHGQADVRRLMSSILNQLLPAPLIRGELPSHVEVTVTRQLDLARTMVHVLSYAPQRRTPAIDIVEEATPLVNRAISLRASASPRSVMLQPGNCSLPFVHANGYVTTRVSSESGHDILVVSE